MDEICKLRAATTGEQTPCDGEACTYWRLVDHLGVTGEASGCAVQYFELLEGGEDIAVWLLSVKRRVEGIEGPASRR